MKDLERRVEELEQEVERLKNIVEKYQNDVEYIEVDKSGQYNNNNGRPDWETITSIPLKKSGQAQ